MNGFQVHIESNQSISRTSFKEAIPTNPFMGIKTYTVLHLYFLEKITSLDWEFEKIQLAYLEEKSAGR